MGLVRCNTVVGGKTRPPELPLHDNIFRQTVVSIFRHCSYLIDNGKSQLVAANESEVHTIHKFRTTTFLPRRNVILSYDPRGMERGLHWIFYKTEMKIWAVGCGLGWTVLKKVWADYEQLLREVFFFFCGQKKKKKKI